MKNVRVIVVDSEGEPRVSSVRWSLEDMEASEYTLNELRDVLDEWYVDYDILSLSHFMEAYNNDDIDSEVTFIGYVTIKEA